MAVEKIDFDKCLGCFNCVDICPMDVLRPGRGGPAIKYRENCQSCYLCVLECPAAAIVVTPWRITPLGRIYGLASQPVE